MIVPTFLKRHLSEKIQLQGITSNSVDLVFTMDTFTRVRGKYIRNYFKEINRVLVKGGEAILHLPNDDLPLSKKRDFTPLSTKKIKEMPTIIDR